MPERRPTCSCSQGGSPTRPGPHQGVGDLPVVFGNALHDRHDKDRTGIAGRPQVAALSKLIWRGYFAWLLAKRKTVGVEVPHRRLHHRESRARQRLARMPSRSAFETERWSAAHHAVTRNKLRWCATHTLQLIMVRVEEVRAIRDTVARMSNHLNGSMMVCELP